MLVTKILPASFSFPGKNNGTGVTEYTGLKMWPTTLSEEKTEHVNALRVFTGKPSTLADVPKVAFLIPVVYAICILYPLMLTTGDCL